MIATILVVDDDVTACQTACRSLRDAGYDCFWANGGEHALTAMAERKEPVDLILIDARLRDMPGPTLAWLMAQRYGELPVLFVSRTSSFDAALLRAARWDFLAKPFTPENLVAAVERMLVPPDTQARNAS